MKIMTAQEAKSRTIDVQSKEKTEDDNTLDKIIDFIEEEIMIGISRKVKGGFPDYHHNIDYKIIIDKFENNKLKSILNKFIKFDIKKDLIDKLCEENVVTSFQKLGYNVSYQSDISRFWIDWK